MTREAEVMTRPASTPSYTQGVLILRYSIPTGRAAETAVEAFTNTITEAKRTTLLAAAEKESAQSAERTLRMLFNQAFPTPKRTT